MYNTHLDHASEEARYKGLSLILNTIFLDGDDDGDSNNNGNTNSNNNNVVLTGDFNAPPTDKVFVYYSSNNNNY
jgi:endonuclease/exonuclease/phosphatase family metal-dependent hydrolase